MSGDDIIPPECNEVGEAGSQPLTGTGLGWLGVSDWAELEASPIAIRLSPTTPTPLLTLIG
jgi:hypothetical protein